MKKKRDYSKLLTRGVIIVLCVFFIGGIAIGAESILEMEGTEEQYVAAESKSALPTTDAQIIDYVNKSIDNAIENKPKTETDDDCDIEDETVKTDGADEIKTTALYLKNDFIDKLESTGELKSAEFGEDISGIVKRLNINLADVTETSCKYDYYVCPVCGEEYDERPDGVCEECGGEKPYTLKARDEYTITIALKDDSESVKNNFRFRNSSELDELISKTSGYFTAENTKISYTNPVITVKVNRLTDKLRKLSFSYDAVVVTGVNFTGDYASLGKSNAEFTVHENYECRLTWPELSLSAEVMKIDFKNTDVLKATLTCDDPTAYDVKWSADDESIATVDEDGYITAGKTPGKLLVSAEFTFQGQKYSDSCVVVVGTPVEGLDISKRNIKLSAGDTFTLKATVSPKKATDKTVSWFTEDESVAVVSDDGTVTAVGKGETKVYALSNDGYYRASCTVEVVK